jgi:membrane protein implicated in regulation of membrane protease activity
VSVINAIQTFFALMALAISLWELLDPTWPKNTVAFYAVLWGMAAIVNMVNGCPIPGVLFGAAAAIQAWLWWQKRPPRNRRPSKTLATIRDLGHRLVVAS